jgi:two-component sensor histidine kinase
VRRSFGNGTADGVNFGELIQRVLQPHAHAKSTIEGPILALGEQATNNLPLVFHEFATNAAKYGALSKDTGTVAVKWSTDDGSVKLTWKEAGGPLTKPPEALGFGSKLVETTVARIGGQIEYDRCPQGLSARFTLPLNSLKA